MDKDRWTPRDAQSTGDNEEEVFDLFADMQDEDQPASVRSEESFVNTQNENTKENDIIDQTKKAQGTSVTETEEDAEELEGWSGQDLTRMFQNSEMEEASMVEEPEEVPDERSAAAPMPKIEDSIPIPSAGYEPPMEESTEDASLDDEEKGVKKLIRTLAIIGVGTLVILCIAVVGFYYYLQGDHGNQQAESSQDSTTQVAYDGQELYGVIQSIDAELGTATVYTADTDEEKVFDLKNAEKITDQYGNEISYVNLHRGQVVNVQYNAANEDAVSLFRLTSKVSELKNVYGAIVYGDTLTVSGASYSIDENLICLYQGQDYDIQSLTMQQVFTAKILDGHIYTVYVSYSTGELELKDYEEYIGGRLSVTSTASGTSVSADITEDMEPLQVLEGVNTVSITMDSATVYSGKIFVVSEETYELSLPVSSERIGKVTLVADPSSASITIDGVSYAVGETIELSYGQHQLTAYADGFSSYEKTITVGQPYQRLLITMTNNVTTVSITSALNGSAVYIDGEYYGTAPVQVKLTPGSYIVSLVTDGYKDVSMKVTVTEGKLEQVVYFSEFVADQPVNEPDSSSVPESSSSVPESSSQPSSSVPESSTPESSVPESSVPESSSQPESSVPDSSVTDSSESVPVDSGSGDSVVQ